MKALTANDLRTGDTVFWSQGAWVEQFADAEIFEGDAADQALALAEKQMTLVVAPYLFDVQETPDGLAPVAYRERVRALGPTNHPQHGKQAEGAHLAALTADAARARSTGRLSLIKRH